MNVEPATVQPARSPSARFSILALDGGGARGYLSVKILERIEACLDAMTGRPLPLGARFDLIVGTSTGGIIALALSLGLTARRVAALYETHLPRIFGPAMRRSATAALFRPRYRREALRTSLLDFFGERTLADAHTDVCITTTSLMNAKPLVFCTDYAGHSLWYQDEALVDLALATSAAPTFFEAHSTRNFTDLADGGLYAGNPALLGLVEAFRFARDSRRGVAPPNDLAGRCLDRLALLSIGSGEQCAMPYAPEALARGGALRWGRHFHNVSLQSQAHQVHELTRGLLGGAYRRINPRLPFPMALDDVSSFARLKNLSELSEGDEDFLCTHLVSAVGECANSLCG